MGSSPDNRPRFISSFTNALPFFYFHHIIDADNALLTVEVIGPNLSFTFSHARAKGFSGPAAVAARLTCKTVGFLSLVRGDDRHVLALAQSGHGGGKRGDLLDAPLDSPVLPNLLWARRVARLGALLGLKMASHRDTGRLSGDTVVTGVDGLPTLLKDHNYGLFQGGHVEVKLVVYAVCTMLKEFGITTDFDNITTVQLRKLRRVRWEDGSRPEFEVYFSREQCAKCRMVADALSAITGLRIALCWKDRLVKMIYTPQKAKRAPTSNTRETGPTAAAAGSVNGDTMSVSDIIEIDEDDDDELGEVISISGTSENTVDLTRGDDLVRSEVDLTLRADSILERRGLPVDLTLHEEFGDIIAPAEQDDANTAGQAVATLARSQGALNLAHLVRAKSAIIPTVERDINKPLPATPVTEFPDPPGTDDFLSGAHRIATLRARSLQHPSRVPPTPRVLRFSEPSRKRRLSSPAILSGRQKNRRIAFGNIPERELRASPSLEADDEASSSDEGFPDITPTKQRSQHLQPSIETDDGESSSEESIPHILPAQRRPSAAFIRNRSSHIFAARDARTGTTHTTTTTTAINQLLTPPKTPLETGQAPEREALTPTRQIVERTFSASPSPF